jgi:septin family protein
MVAYDSPGYGDFIDNQKCIDKIKSYIISRHKQWADLQPQAMTEAEYLEADNRIHCVFYFIAPHRMKMLDKEFIQQLAKLVCIIPIIAKADTMTLIERNDYLEVVKNSINEISQHLNESSVYDFEHSDINLSLSPRETDAELHTKFNGLEIAMTRVPNIFAVVCDPSNERVYPWGTLRVDDNRHSDLRRLQTILFENGKFSKYVRMMSKLCHITPPLHSMFLFIPCQYFIKLP